jgi:formylglycine-generating enzyme
MIYRNNGLRWFFLACFLGLVSIKLKSPAEGGTSSPVIQKVQMIGKSPELTISAQIGQTNKILCASAVWPSDWKELTNILVTHSAYVVVDAGAQILPNRFYEVIVAEGTKPASPTNMVRIPPGGFLMGSPTNEPDRGWVEGPQVWVVITREFWMGKYEVTQREYEDLMHSKPSFYFRNPNRPVEQVTWFDAVAYCAVLTAQEQALEQLPAGYVYRLPTEAEWEYACRAGTTNATAFGDSLSSMLANFDGNNPYHGATKGPLINQTTNVGSYTPNLWGLYDMHGNVAEWCWDWYWTDLPTGSVTDPTGHDTGVFRVVRGGCWTYTGRDCRSATRDKRKPEEKHNYLGFRVVLAPALP